MNLDNQIDFQQWLEQQPPERIVGARCQAESCPVATWLTDTAGCDVLVGPRFVDLKRDANWQLIPFWSGHTKFDTPDWMVAIIKQVDRMDHDPTAAEMLDLLARLPSPDQRINLVPQPF